MTDEVARAREELIRAAFALWNDGDRDPDALGIPFADDFVLDSALTGRTFHGREGMVEWMSEIDDTFGAWRTSVADIQSAGSDRFLILGAVHMKGRGSGLEYDQSIGWIIEFDGDALKALRNFASHEAAIAAAAETE